ncbi:phosphatidate cytidylyltransferase [Sphingobacterium olei]|uniref:Phosphatidate cytidylyltransferase n=1 Tax=Sphingobacterium olei TaxID=2571155 RepID=A0A4V5MMK7_9SPHI|nr:phosphatidate cytidylyltransferase [Sphingobacterium olei]TJZ61348.1 phosphatidate cytidylyltransferase [Sphingobacterium olei]
MTQSVINAIVLAGCYLLLFALGELLYHYFKVKVEITRKIIHAGTGLLALLFPLLLDNHWLVLTLCALFAAILILSLRYHLLPSINAIDRRSIGSLAYPIAVYGCYLAYHLNASRYAYYYLPILILAICDPIAGLTGKRWAIGPYHIAGAHKTLMGSLMFLCSAMLLTAGYFGLFCGAVVDSSFMFTVACVASLSTLAEAVSRDGYDNLTIPFSVILGLMLTKSIV